MNIEERVRILENKVAQLSEAFLNAQRQNVPVVSKVDDTANKVVEITPYTDSKTAYIGDYQVLFENTPQGILTVSAVDSEGGFPAYVLEREGGTVAVHFLNPLEYVTTVSIVIQ
jgi:hypothetical protein